MQKMILDMINESISVKEKILASQETVDATQKISKMIIDLYHNKKKVLLCGNGGSAADAQHLAAELVSKFKMVRHGLPAVSLNTNTSIMTAVANDYDFSRIFARQVEALGCQGDLIIGLSTSGNSSNVYEAFTTAKDIGVMTVGFLGGNGGKIAGISDIPLIIPSNDTPRIQESHIMIGHIICEIVEKELFRKNE